MEWLLEFGEIDVALSAILALRSIQINYLSRPSDRDPSHSILLNAVFTSQNFVSIGEY